MKTRFLTYITAFTLFAALAIPVGLDAQKKQDHHHKHHAGELVAGSCSSSAVAQIASGLRPQARGCKNNQTAAPTDRTILLKTDQRGKPRPDKEDLGGCDVGAYERQNDWAETTITRQAILNS